MEIKKTAITATGQNQRTLPLQTLVDGNGQSKSALAARVPTYVTIKAAKKRRGQGPEDLFPVSQFEKLWGDMTALPEIQSRFVVVPRLRGQQLKDQSQLDGWLRDDSAHVDELCEWA
jgi:hypothetical protein